MFWLKRLKTAEDDAHWSLPYGDLMSLLLAVFVMIAAMSELKAGAQYDRVAGGVRRAFGFAEPASPEALGIATTRPMTLLDRIEQAAIGPTGMVRLASDGDEDLAPCEVVRGVDRLVLRFRSGAAFELFGAVPRPAAGRLLARVGDYLASGRAGLEIRGYGDPGAMPAGAPFRDAWDVSYQRARAAADVLAQRGVASQRMWVVAAGVREAPVGAADPWDGSIADTGSAARAIGSGGADCQLEIVVRAAAADPHAG